MKTKCINNLFIFMSCIFCLLVLLSCNRKNQKHETEVILKENIFEYLLLNLPTNLYYFKNNKDFKVTEVFPDDYLRPEREIIVENEYFRITYYPTSNPEIFEPHHVRIFKRNDKITLGELIGENIENLSQRFFNEFIIKDRIYHNHPPEHERYTFYDFGWHPNSTGDPISERISLQIWVIDNVIEKIDYHYIW
ncbi:MAG: hypothetical protein FWD87_11060 [Spirochaetaceae bacterium]|nr:hypothetical protein [Spirochaetaceae bacterium]